MKINLNVDVRRLTRIEGHGSIRVKVENGEVKEAGWNVVEPPRFFEVMLKGAHYESAGILASRICGICSISHCLCAINAAEKAFGVKVPDTATRLRLLARHAETLQSHALHVLFLAVPDFLSEPGVIPLIEKKPELVAVAAGIKGFANRVCDAVAGRSIHPVAFRVGGVTAVPSGKDLANFGKELQNIVKDLRKAARFMATLQTPEFERETEYVSLKGEKDYAFVGDKVVSSDGVEMEGTDYLKIANEYVDGNNTSKWTRLSRQSYAVGPLARFNNNHRLLHPEAVEVAETLGLKPLCHNPFMGNAARIVECFHTAHEMTRLIDELRDTALDDVMAEVQPAAGEGVGVVEAPRGILFHHLVFNDQGLVEKANCVVPTTQNNANIHYDLKSFAKQFATGEMTDEKLELLCSMLVRSYDPCLSCSVH